MAIGGGWVTEGARVGTVSVDANGDNIAYGEEQRPLMGSEH